MDYTKIPLVFNVKKPVGVSSFDVVHHFKKNLNFDFGKIGHFGTLDPFAEGVLLIGVQGAQKINDYVHELLPKTYRAHGLFGGKTESGDLTAPIIREMDIDQCWRSESIDSLELYLKEKFLGEYWQSPHSVSAAKFEGKRLYHHALQGRIIRKEKVKREIYSFKILQFDYPRFSFEVSVSSGTYVRSLFEEIAELLGGVGALERLERISIGEIRVEQALERPHWPLKGDLNFSLKDTAAPLDSVLSLDRIILSLAQTKRYLQGQRLKLSDLEKQENSQLICSENYLWIYNEDGNLLGMGKAEGLELHAIFNLKLAISLFS
ncbi:MAG: tRNA pseudouridine synthase B [Bacteriovorax sp.]